MDFKPRDAADFSRLAAEVHAEIKETLAMMARFDLGSAASIDEVAARVNVVAKSETAQALGRADLVFEGVPATSRKPLTSRYPISIYSAFISVY